MANHQEQRTVTEDGRVIVKCVDTSEYEEITIKYPLGFERKKLVKVEDNKDGNTNTAQAAKKPWSKKKKLGVGLGAILAAAIGGRALANALDKHNDEDEEYDDSYDEDVDDNEDEDEEYDDSDE